MINFFFNGRSRWPQLFPDWSCGQVLSFRKINIASRLWRLFSWIFRSFVFYDNLEGGYDVYASIPLYQYLKNHGHHCVLANLTFVHFGREEKSKEGVCNVVEDSLWKCSPPKKNSSPGEGLYFPELYLAEFLRDDVFVIERRGVKYIRSAYERLLKDFDIGAIILVDGGTARYNFFFFFFFCQLAIFYEYSPQLDVWWRRGIVLFELLAIVSSMAFLFNNLKGLGTPEEDFSSIAAVDSVKVIVLFPILFSLFSFCCINLAICFAY